MLLRSVTISCYIYDLDFTILTFLDLCLDPESIYVKWELLSDPSLTFVDAALLPSPPVPAEESTNERQNTCTSNIVPLCLDDHIHQKRKPQQYNPHNCRYGPSAREMHGTSSIQGRMFISGGRNEDGLLSDVWELTVTTVSATEVDVTNATDQNINPVDCNSSPNILTSTSVSSSSSSSSSSHHQLEWIRRNDLTLPAGRCAHGATAIYYNMPLPLNDTNTTADTSSNSSSSSMMMVLIGGFVGSAKGCFVSDELLATPLTLSSSSTTVCNWRSLACRPKTFAKRFGLSACAITLNTMDHLATKYNLKIKNQIIAKKNNSATVQHTATAVLMFGGVNEEQDFGDIWLLLPILPLL